MGVELCGGAAIAMQCDSLIHSSFYEQARRTPDAIALSSGDRTLSYGQLARLADRTAAAVAQGAPLASREA